MLMPKRVKHRKQHRGRMTGKASGGNKIDFGEFGLQALQPCWLTNRQIEAARIAITRYIRRGGKVWIRVFPDKPFTKKPAETRMGSGKGSPEGWVAVVKPGRILFELRGVSEEVAKEAVRRAIHKLPIRARFVTRKDFEHLYTEKERAAELEQQRALEAASAASEQSDQPEEAVVGTEEATSTAIEEGADERA